MPRLKPQTVSDQNFGADGTKVYYFNQTNAKLVCIDGGKSETLAGGVIPSTFSAQTAALSPQGTAFVFRVEITNAAHQDGHAGYSDPLDEQTFLVNLTNFLQKQPTWHSTAIVVMYDDSDGWYDHQMGPIVNQSTGPTDALTGPNACGTATLALPGIDPGNVHALGRCGYGPRQPFLVISPWARSNFVDHTITDQTSVLRFIEDNWLGGQRIGQGSFDAIANSITQMFDFQAPKNSGRLYLDPNTGQPR